MRHSAPRLFLVGLLSVGTFIAACGGGDATPPIPNYELDGSPVGPGDSSVDDSSMAADTADAADTAPVDCPVVVPDDTMGIYVATTGMNGASCGTRAAPCKTIAVGITRAVAASKTQVDIAAGTYAEQVTLAAGIELIGGWDINNGSSWTRSCITPGQITILKAPALQTSTIVAADLGGEAKLTLLRIESKAAASVLPGESLYGILATGSTTTLTLKDVTIEVASAGAGTSPGKGTDGAPIVGTCVAGTGLVGAPATVGTGAPAGAFGASGYTAAVATAGSAGNAGNNGTAGGASSAPPQCQSCGTCSAFADPTPCTFTANAAPTCGTNGSAGCGGNPGGAGAPGSGGGSSIGVFSWDATISVTGGTVKSGDGGNGAAGGAGGAAGAGSAGTAGVAAPACITACGAADLVNLVCKPNTTTVPTGGTIGGAGGPGSAGGAGGGGGGGSSYATYQGGAALITSTATLTPGKPGTGGGAGASAGTPGTAAPHFP